MFFFIFGTSFFLAFILELFHAKLTTHGFDVEFIRPARKNEVHQVIFSIKQRNVHLLEEELMKVSSPTSIDYGKHWTRQQIGEFTANWNATNAVKQYISENQLSVLEETLFGEYIVAEGRVSELEKIFKTTFNKYLYKDPQHNSQKYLIRANDFQTPIEIRDHISHVFNIDHFPAPIFSFEPKNVDVKPMTTYKNTVTPKVLNKVYSINNLTGSSNASQAIFGTIGQMVSPEDLKIFQRTFSLSDDNITTNINGFIDDKACFDDLDNCLEANLDIQYIMGIAQKTPTTYFYWPSNGDIWLSWILNVTKLNDPPKVISISYASYESAFSSSYLTQFATEAKKLGLQGVTILASSGDDGVAGWLVKNSNSGVSCGYWAMFPASCPYVTAVGGTMGPEKGNIEITCQVPTGLITSGGGISAFYSTPTWQATAVQSYFDTLSKNNVYLSGSYSTIGRGYPDVSLLADRYAIIANKTVQLVSGTSASAPVFAAFITIANSHRHNKGLSSLGFVNPFLYSNSSLFINDITYGNNKCTSSSSKCCSQGYYAIVGWDPVTGLGSVDLSDFLKASGSYSPEVDSTSSSSSFNLNVVIIVVPVILGFLALVVVVLGALFYIKHVRSRVTNAPF